MSEKPNPDDRELTPQKSTRVSYHKRVFARRTKMESVIIKLLMGLPKRLSFQDKPKRKRITKPGKKT